MARVFFRRASNLAEAWLLKDLLVEHGIDAEVRGEHLIGLAGMIPLRDSVPAVWIPAADLDRARAIVARAEGPSLVHPRWRCAVCGEEHEPAFDTCWQCLTPRG